MKNRLETLKLLRNEEIYINKRDNDERSSFLMACINDSFWITEYLID